MESDLRWSTSTVGPFTYLFCHQFCGGLPDADPVAGHVGGEVAEGRVLHGEHAELVQPEDDVVHRHHVTVGRQEVRNVILADKVLHHSRTGLNLAGLLLGKCPLFSVDSGFFRHF